MLFSFNLLTIIGLLNGFNLFQGDYVVEKIEPLVTEEDFDKIVVPIILEYFNHSITKEVEVRFHVLLHLFWQNTLVIEETPPPKADCVLKEKSCFQ